MRFCFYSCLFLLLGVFFVGNMSYAQSTLKFKYKKSTLYAGIEVGSKGVKMSLVEMARNSNSIAEYNVVKDSSVNTDFISFTPVSTHETLNGLAGLYQTAIKKYQISPDKIFVVVSSGVKVTADRLDKKEWISHLIDSFRIRVDDSDRKVEVIGPEEEARLSHLGIVPDSKRFSTFLIDIGSGNTKGGYFPGPGIDHIKLFSLDWGTKSITNAANERMGDDKSLGNYYKQLQRVLAGEADKEVTYAVNISGAYNMSDNIAFSGGASWAVATLMLPEMLDNPVVPVTYQQVQDFFTRLYNDYNVFLAKNLSASLKGTHAEKLAVQKAASTVNKVFDQKQMLAGTGLLLKIMRQFEGIYEKKQFYLVKNGQVGWISAYVNESIHK
ncbi:MAG: hypothetical protein J0H55_07205 [Chitinophagaceae bacterium]|nr:hypothetical protein [Chitinophagaceae bacterium]